MKYKDHTLSMEERISDLLGRMSLDEKISLLSETSKPIERLGLQGYYHGNEALHGVVRPGSFTVFPQAIALAGTWNPELVFEIAEAISDEARARHHASGGKVIDKEYGELYSGLLTFWSPDLNLARDPRWGRTGETYGEDPYLAGCMGVAFVKGLQGNDRKYLKVVATPKHFTANNEEHNRFECNARIPERELREYYLAPFEQCVKEGRCQAVMAAYNAVNGIPCHADKRLLTTILREEWGFDGYVVSDCGAVSHLVDRHKYVNSPEEAATAAINAGVDLECGTWATFEQVYLNNLGRAVEMGMVNVETIDRAARNVLTARFRLGMYDPQENLPWSQLSEDIIGCEKHTALSLEAARQSITLLKNDPCPVKKLLPLNKKGTLAVIGNNAAVCQFGDYSGSPVNSPVSPLEGLLQEVGESMEIIHIPWHYRSSSEDFVPIPAANMFPGLDKSGENGLLGQYYQNQNFFGTPAARIDSSIDFEWQNMAPDPLLASERFSIRWTGCIVPDVSGEYRIRFIAKGPSECEPAKLLINGRDTGRDVMLYMKEGEACQITLEFSKVLEAPMARLEWVTPGTGNSNSFEAEIAAAKHSDTVIAFVGLGNEYESEGHDKESLDLPPEQLEMLRQVIGVNPKTIVVLINGSPLILGDLHEKLPAVIEAWYPGEQGGKAIADVIFGRVNPSGRLPLTFYKSNSQLPMFDDYEITNGRTYMYMKQEPLYCFGHGLSYTTFEYGALTLDRNSACQNDIITVSADITNTGSCEGEEVVQLYVRYNSTGNYPLMQLKGFTRIALNASETKRVVIRLKVESLAFWNDLMERFQVEPGSYEIMLGSSSADIRQRTGLEVNPV